MHHRFDLIFVLGSEYDMPSIQPAKPRRSIECKDQNLGRMRTLYEEYVMFLTPNALVIFFRLAFYNMSSLQSFVPSNFPCFCNFSKIGQ